MSFKTEPVSPSIDLVRVGKVLDFRNADDFKAKLRSRVEEEVNTFILDFSETVVLDSTGLGAIVSIYREVAEEGQIAFANVPEPVENIIQVTDLYKIIHEFPSVQDAKDTLRA